MTSELSDLCRQLASLCHALDCAVAPARPGTPGSEPPGRSTRVRAALLWCSTHHAAHRRDEWRQEECVPAQDPRRANALLMPTLAATAPKWSRIKRSLSSSSPVDEHIIDLRIEIHIEVTGLARYARRALGHTTRDHDVVKALGILPDLLEQLPDGHALSRRAKGILDSLRQRARVALDIDRRPLELGECESTREPYAATWMPWEIDGEWVWVPAAEFTDGKCREYDTARSRPDATPPLDVWRPSRLYIRDPQASADAEDGWIRCPGCRRIWKGEAGRAELYRLMRPDLEDCRIR